MSRLAVLLLPALLAPGCTCRGSRSSPPPAASATPTVLAAPDAGAGASRPVVLDVTRNLDACSLGHRGVLVDFGDPSAAPALHPGSVRHAVDDVVEHEGATWLRARARTITASFTWTAVPGDSPDASVYVEARVRGAAARAVILSLDGKAVGSVTLSRTGPRVATLHPPVPMTLQPGSHELALRFIGGPRTSDEPLGEIDWVHIGTGDASEPYAAPTRADVLTEANVGGRAMRGLSLRAPGFVRCATWLPANATIEASLATIGGGDADVEARLLRDRRAPVVLGAAHVAGGGSAWVPWSVPVTGLDGDGALASLEIVVKRAAKGTRVLLGEPRAVVAESSPLPTPPPARGVVLVVLGDVPAKAFAPWGGPHAAPELSRLAASGTTFTANRATSSLASSVMATLLTGLPARLHGVDDPDARLPAGPTTLEEACRQAGVTTAMFTANPTTGAVFGFGRGWDTFTLHDPLENVPSTAVFDDAAAWIDAHKGERFLVVVHARGGHPPWEATPDELKAMPPDNYFGMIEPQRAAEALGKVRKHAARFKEDDRARAWALYDHALDQHDAALGRLLAALKAAGRDGDTAVLVTGDVAPTEGPPVPFVDVDGLDEPLLATPLVVRWPGSSALAGKRVDATTSPLDAARTVADALGLAPVPESFEGDDLARVAGGELVPSTRPLEATRAGRFSVRWGQYVLVGARDRELRMCDLTLDVACVADVRSTSPLALEPIHRWAVDAFGATKPAAPPREAAQLDDHTTAALVRWGRPANERDGEEEK